MMQTSWQFQSVELEPGAYYLQDSGSEANLGPNFL